MTQGNIIRELLGLTQEEIAFALKISRSHWSLFELGKRDLPLGATPILAEMLQHIEAKKAAKGVSKSAPLHKKMHKELEHLLKENEYRTSLLSRKINTLEKKLNNSSRAMLLADYLARNENGKVLAKSVESKASQITEEDTLDLFRYKLKLEFLHLERPILQAKLEKL